MIHELQLISYDALPPRFRGRETHFRSQIQEIKKKLGTEDKKNSFIGRKASPIVIK
jgi:hypothetical protein